ncbi:MAG: Phosphodiesterase/alkaline phosphatase D, partial [uncultured Friedmanniella sp.]
GLAGAPVVRAAGVRGVDAGALRGGRHAVPPSPVRPAGQPLHARPAHLPRRAGRVTGRRRAERPGPDDHRPRAVRLPARRPRRRAGPVEARRQPGDDHARSFPERPGHPDGRRGGDARRRPTAAGAGSAVQRRPVGRLPRGAGEGAGPPARPRHPRHRLPHRRHPLRLGLRPADRWADLSAERQQRRRRAGLHVGDQRQPRRHHELSAPDHLAGGGDGVQGQQPAHQVPRLRLARVLRARGDPVRSTDGLVRPHRPRGPERGGHPLGVLPGSRRHPAGRDCSRAARM